MGFLACSLWLFGRSASVFVALGIQISKQRKFLLLQFSAVATYGKFFLWFGIVHNSSSPLVFVIGMGSKSRRAVRVKLNTVPINVLCYLSRWYSLHVHSLGAPCAVAEAEQAQPSFWRFTKAPRALLLNVGFLSNLRAAVDPNRTVAHSRVVGGGRE